MNTQIITPGEKIKAFRKNYKIKQHEISGNDISRNMLSMIENNKAGLIESTAKILIQNINKICQERSINFTITLESLLESGESQANKICKKFISILDNTPEVIMNNNFNNDFNSVISIINKYNLKHFKSMIYSKLGDYYTEIYDFQKAYTHYLISFENQTDLFNNSDVITLIMNINYCCTKLNKYSELLEFNRLAYIYMNNIDVENEFKINYNNALAYKKLNDFNSCLEVIDSIEFKFKNILMENLIRKINLMIIKANCYTDNNRFSEALTIHKQTLEITHNNIEMHLFVLINMIEIYIELNDRKNLKIYLDKSVFLLKEYLTKEEKKYSSQIFKNIGLGFYFLEEYEMSKLYFNKALIEAKKYKNSRIVSLTIRKLLDISINLNEQDEIYNLKNQFLEIISLGISTDNSLIFEFIKYYNNIGDSQTINDIINFIQSK